MKKIIAMIAGIVMILAMGGVANANPGDKNPNKWTCTLDTPVVNIDNPKMHVKVPEGETCTVENSTIKMLQNEKGATNVYVYDSKVERGIHLIGVTNDVVIGVRGCNYDPEVGNNIHVHKSHNVLICYESAKRNIIVAQNDGKITVRNSTAGNNIMVNNNYAYNPDSDDNTGHRRPGTIRILNNTAGNHITARNNEDRKIRAVNNSPAVVY